MGIGLVVGPSLVVSLAYQFTDSPPYDSAIIVVGWTLSLPLDVHFSVVCVKSRTRVESQNELLGSEALAHLWFIGRNKLLISYLWGQAPIPPN